MKRFLDYAGLLYLVTQINNKINTISGLLMIVVNSLPTANAQTVGKIYLVPTTSSASSSSEPDFYNQYITVINGSTYSWLSIGALNIDLAGYAKLNDNGLSITAMGLDATYVTASGHLDLGNSATILTSDSSDIYTLNVPKTNGTVSVIVNDTIEVPGSGGTFVGTALKLSTSANSIAIPNTAGTMVVKNNNNDVSGLRNVSMLSLTTSDLACTELNLGQNPVIITEDSSSEYAVNVPKLSGTLALAENTLSTITLAQFDAIFNN